MSEMDKAQGRTGVLLITLVVAWLLVELVGALASAQLSQAKSVTSVLVILAALVSIGISVLALKAGRTLRRRSGSNQRQGTSIRKIGPAILASAVAGVSAVSLIPDTQLAEALVASVALLIGAPFLAVFVGAVAEFRRERRLRD